MRHGEEGGVSENKSENMKIQVGEEKRGMGKEWDKGPCRGV